MNRRILAIPAAVGCAAVLAVRPAAQTTFKMAFVAPRV